MDAFIELAKVFGPSVAFMAFTVWRDYMRENRMGNRLDTKEDQVLGLAQKSVTAIEQNTASNNRLTEAIERLPCREVIPGVDSLRRRNMGAHGE